MLLLGVAFRYPHRCYPQNDFFYVIYSYLMLVGVIVLFSSCLLFLSEVVYQFLFTVVYEVVVYFVCWLRMRALVCLLIAEWLCQL